MGDEKKPRASRVWEDGILKEEKPPRRPIQSVIPPPMSDAEHERWRWKTMRRAWAYTALLITIGVLSTCEELGCLGC
jgi:hypothetical protein